ncbi:MAG: hypothetical protein GY869_25680, partial [Planctomycetes bacterium]|nr:hypothetical protein [Planctomycetota bacterium]
STNQLKIKNCIYDFYQNQGTVWVLLGGDDTVVPDQDTFGSVSGGSYTDTTIPCDLFYACFDNQFDWDADTDGIVGETDDNIDMAPEVIIGRAPVRSTTDVSAFVDKTLNYEQNPPTSNFANQMLVTGLKLWHILDDNRSDADWKGEKMRDEYITPNWNGTSYRLYDTNTDFGGPSYDVTADHISDRLNDGYNHFFMATHGNQTIWSTESGSYFYSSHAQNLTNVGKQGIIVTIACITNAFENGKYGNDPCLSEGFIRNPNGGAVGYWGSSRYGWGYHGYNHGSSFQYADYFYQYLFSGQPDD